MTTNKKMCEEATGCKQQGSIVYCDDKGEKISCGKAIELFNNREVVEVPSAGAGSYEEIFTSLGFQEVKVIDWTSSAGDWHFGVKNEQGWFVAWQENRYPHHGFRYSISDLVESCDTFEKLCELSEDI